MLNERRFNAAIALKGETRADAAKIMGMNPATLFRKMNGKSDFYRAEIQRFCEYYNVAPQDIFFAEHSAQMQKTGKEGNPMAEKSISGEHFVQVGVTALRDPATGDFLPSVPLYIKVEPESIDAKSGLAQCELDLCRDIGGVLAAKFAEYVDGCRRAGISV